MLYLLSDLLRCTCSHWGRNLKIHSPVPRRQRNPWVWGLSCISGKGSESIPVLCLSCGERQWPECGAEKQWMDGRVAGPPPLRPAPAGAQGQKSSLPLESSQAPSLIVPPSHPLSHPVALWVGVLSSCLNTHPLPSHPCSSGHSEPPWGLRDISK